MLYPLQSIYIPIWLDLLYPISSNSVGSQLYLHSNMVRFIMNIPVLAKPHAREFTFQYG